MENKIALKIISDAEERALAIRTEAEEKAKVTLGKADSEIAAMRLAAEKERERMLSEARRAAKVRAELQLKKDKLAAEKSVIDMVFSNAMKKIAELPKKEYLEIIAKLLAEAESGDEVRISENDKGVITEAFVKKIADKLKIKLKLSKKYADISGGIILSGAVADKNLSLEADFKELRETYEPEVARILFGEAK